MEITVSSEKKSALVDLLIIFAVTAAVLGAYMAVQHTVASFARDASVHVLLRTLVMALMQFGIAGLGISLVALIRKESFASHGLIKRNMLLSVVLCALTFVPYIIFGLATGQISCYLPFSSVWMAKELLSGGFITGAAGYLIMAVAWGFFEGFNYVVICDKLNKLVPVKHRWLNFGAIIWA